MEMRTNGKQLPGCTCMLHFFKAFSSIVGLRQILYWLNSLFWGTSTKSICALLPQNLLRKRKIKILLIFLPQQTINIAPAHHNTGSSSSVLLLQAQKGLLCSAFYFDKEVKVIESKKLWRFFCDILKAVVKIYHFKKILCPIQTLVPKANPRKQGQWRNCLRT